MSSNHDDDATRVKRAAGDAGAVTDIPGVTLGRQLGRGGMAIVLEGSDRGFNPPRRVAVKIMDTTLSSDEEFRARFDAEASIVAGFRHPNIVQVYSSGETAGAKYMVMEYLPGGTLADRLRSDLVDAKEAVAVAADLADALAYSHEHGIVHRDFKPANVLFTADGKPVLSDFGVAKSNNSERASLTRHASVIGAPRYMAPEQERADDDVSYPADVYSFGMTLYEMLTGSVPPLDTLVQLGKNVPQELEARLAGQAPAVVRLIHGCLQASPAARPSAAECRDRLRALRSQAGEKTASAAKPVPVRVVVGLAAAVVLAMLAVSVYWYSNRPAGDAPPPARNVSVVITRSPATARVFVANMEVTTPVIDIAPGRYAVTAVAAGHYGTTQELVAEASPASLRVVLEPAVAMTSMDSIDRFFELADAETITAADVDSVEERSLASAVRMKLFRQQGDGAALDLETQRLRALEASGDEFAPVALMLDSVVRQGTLGTEQLTPAIVAAADRGSALASYFVAMAQRYELGRDGATADPTSTLYLDYCARMRTAADRGMREVAEPFLRRDECPGP